jgi:DNA uptake protein ComE-like DNA-binding protein
VVIALLIVIFTYLVIKLMLNPVYVSDPQPRAGPRAAEVESKIDPNTADWSTLAALPQIGEGRARQIVAYREQFLAQNPGAIAFTGPTDLHRVRGIGVGIVSLIEPYLVFPASQPSTQSTQPVR